MKGKKMNIGQNYNTNYNVSTCSRPAFKGAIGEKLLKELSNSQDTIELSHMMNEVKGVMGPNKTKVQDVVESFIGKIKELNEVLPKKEAKARELQQKIYEMPEDWRVENNARESVYQSFANKNSEMSERSRDVQKRLDAAKAEASKYEPMKEVKSIEELGVMMPEQIKSLIDETNSNKNIAAESMFNHLMSGADGTEAFKQIDRYKKLFKSGQDGMFNITELRDYAQEKQAPYGEPVYAALELIKMSLKGSPQGSYLESYSQKDIVSKRAMEVLKPLCKDENRWTDSKYVKENLNKNLEEVINFHRNFPKGKAKIMNNNPECEIIDHKAGFDTRESMLELKHPNGHHMKWSYDDVAYAGRY